MSPPCASFRIDLPVGTSGEPKMLKTILITVCFVSSLLLLGCAKTEVTTGNGNTAAPPATKTTPATSATTPATASAGDKIGIAECDEFITPYENCVNNKVPAAASAQFNSALSQWLSSWQ